MGTRSIIVVTGRHPYGGEDTYQTVRLYKHWDGYPTGNLDVILLGIRRAKQVLASFQRHSPEKTVTDIPASCMADCIIAESVGWKGATAEIDNQDVVVDGVLEREIDASFTKSLDKSHFGRQGDLEWVYIVDILKQAIVVFANGSYDEPMAHLKHGPTDPLSYADELIPEAQYDERTQIAMLVDLINEEDWLVNPAEYRIKGVRWSKPKKKASSDA